MFSPGPARWRAWLERPRMPITAAIIAFTLASPALFTGLYVDDTMHRGALLNTPEIHDHFISPNSMFDFVSDDPVKHRFLVDSGIFPWWTYEGTVLSFWRPVTVLTHRLDYALWPDIPFLMHLQSLLWWAGAAIAAGLVYRRTISPAWCAGLAMLLYAIDDAYAMPVGWVANRNACIAACFVWFALWAHIRARDDKQPAFMLLAYACTVAALLSNEGAIAIGGYLFAYAVTRDPAGFKKGFLWLLPYLGIVIVWRAYYSIQGYGAHGSQSYIDPAADPMRFVHAMIERIPPLFVGMWLNIPAEIYAGLRHALHTPYWIVLVALSIIVIAAVIARIVRNRDARFFAIGMAFALVPACTSFPADRLLVFAGFGAMGLVAQFVAWAYESGTTRLNRRIAAALLVVHIAVAAVFLPLRILGFAGIGKVMENAIADENFPVEMEGRTLVVASSPNPFFTAYLPLERASRGLDVPKYIRNLAPLHTVPFQTVELYRPDATTIDVTPVDGFPWMLVRDDDHPLPAGHVVKSPGIEIEVMSLHERGWPHRVQYRFDVPLEDESLAWVRVKGIRFIEFTPPAIGERMTLKP